MRTILIIILSLLVMISPDSRLNAQEQPNCTQNLLDAQNMFNQGQIQDVPGLLIPCIESGFSKDERIRAYKLLINAYIFDDYPSQAEKYMLEFLKKYPEYIVAPSDPPEFVNLLEEFNNSPRASIGFQLGTNMSNIRPSQTFGVHNLNNNGADYRSAGIGFQSGFFFNYNILQRLEVSIEPSYSYHRYGYEGKPFSFSIVNYTESQNRIDLPLSILWRFQIQDLQPYIRLGARASYLFQATGNADRTYVNTGNVTYDDISNTEYDILNRRNEINYWAFFGTGIRYKIPRAYIFFDVRYNLGLKNQVINSSRNIPEDDLVWLHYYMQDDFFMDDLSLRIGIAKTLYNPKRK